MSSNPIKIISGLFEKLIVEHGSAVVQGKHIALLKEQFSLLGKENSTLKSDNEVLKSKLQNLEKENIELKQKIQLHNETPKPFFHANLLWLQNDPNPYCPACYGSDNKLVHMATIQIQDIINDDIIHKDVFMCSTSPKCKNVAEISKNPKL